MTGTQKDVRTFLALLRAALMSQLVGSADSAAPAEVERALDSVQVPLEALLVGGVHELIPGVAMLGPAPATREHELTVYLRVELSRAMELTTLTRTVYREYSAKNMGQALKVEVDPAM